MKPHIIASNGIEAITLLQLPGATRPEAKPQGADQLWTIEFTVLIGGAELIFLVMDIHSGRKEKFEKELQHVWELWHGKEAESDEK